MAFAHRPLVMATTGMVVSGHHKASEAGAEMLRRGGNAVDAAVAAAATLAVAIPHMNGLGGDAIALFYDARADEVTAINGSGRAPLAASVERYRELGHRSIPQRGPLSITVPGVVHAWGECLQRWGTRPLAECLEFAIDLAEAGVPIDASQRDFLTGPLYAELAEGFSALADLFGAATRSRRIGERLRQPVLASTLRRLAADGAESFYGGAVGNALLADLKQAGALISGEDLSRHATLFGGSLQIPYRGRKVHAAPPNSQGIALTLLLGLSQAMERDRPASAEPDAPIEPVRYMRVKKAAFALRDRYAVDPDRVRLPPDLLSPRSLSQLGATEYESDAEARSGGGDTSTLVVVDAAGNAVSWVQSLFEEFGSGVVSERTGIVLHNRLYLEQLNDDPVRGLRPGLRPFHTLCPAIVQSERGCDMTIATPGDHGQPQSIYQVLRHVYEGGASIQEAVEMPRLRHDEGAEVMIEDRAPAEWTEKLTSVGYAVRNVGPWARLMGGVNAIYRIDDDLWVAGADPRRSSYAVTAGPAQRQDEG